MGGKSNLLAEELIFMLETLATTGPRHGQRGAYQPVQWQLLNGWRGGACTGRAHWGGLGMGSGGCFFSLGLGVLPLWPLEDKMGKQMKRDWYMGQEIKLQPLPSLIETGHGV